MKQKIRLGDSYALTKHKPKHHYIRYISLIAVLTSMCLYAVKQVSAQQAEPAATAVAEIKPLQIGDTIPEWLWHHPLQVVNHSPIGGRGIITLNDYRGKFIILDFWATWCSACLDGFPKLDTLMAEFGNDLAVVLVNAEQTGDNFNRVNKRFERLKAKTGYDVKLPCAVGDTVLQQYFPHRIIPHYVWIDADGQLKATTFAREVTRQNVSAAIKRAPYKTHIKRDVFGFDPMATPLAEIHAPRGDRMKFQSLLTGYIEGLGTENGKTTTSDGLTRVYKINASLGTLYNTAFGPERGSLPHNRLIFDLPDQPDFKRKYYDYGNYENRYCYELVSTVDDEERLRSRMKADLESFFNVSIERRRRLVNVLVIRAEAYLKENQNQGEESVSNEAGEMVLQNIKTEFLMTLLNNRITIPVINESSGDIISIRIPRDIQDYTMTELERWLSGNGFSVVRETKELEFVVFNHKFQTNETKM